MECKFCKKVLKNKYSLKIHQEKAKYCLKIQGKTKKGDFVCICGKDFFLKHHYEDHLATCIGNKPFIKDKLKELEVLKIEYKALEKQLSELQTQYNKVVNILATKPTTNNNNTLYTRTQEDIERIVEEKYDKNYLIDGQRGVAHFTYDHILEQDSEGNLSYALTDASRYNGKYKISETEIVVDTEMKGLAREIYPAIKKKTLKMSEKENIMKNKIVYSAVVEIINMLKNNAPFRKEFGSLLVSKFPRRQNGSINQGQNNEEKIQSSNISPVQSPNLSPNESNSLGSILSGIYELEQFVDSLEAIQ